MWLQRDVCRSAEALDLRDGSRLPKTAAGRAFLQLLVRLRIAAASQTSGGGPVSYPGQKSSAVACQGWFALQPSP